MITEEGREARAIEIARQMLKEKESIEKIIRYTGLSKENINQIKAD